MRTCVLAELSTVQATYQIRVQLLEIYNEQLRDLLDPARSGKRLDIRNTERSGTNVPDAIQVCIPVNYSRCMTPGHHNCCRATCMLPQPTAATAASARASATQRGWAQMRQMQVCILLNAARMYLSVTRRSPRRLPNQQ